LRSGATIQFSLRSVPPILRSLQAQISRSGGGRRSLRPNPALSSGCGNLTGDLLPSILRTHTGEERGVCRQRAPVHMRCNLLGKCSGAEANPRKDDDECMQKNMSQLSSPNLLYCIQQLRVNTIKRLLLCMRHSGL
ncbi:hypothetical protein U9M48_030866, partial [Paspalum notatum var. saurae]